MQCGRPKGPDCQEMLPGPSSGGGSHASWLAGRRSTSAAMSLDVLTNLFDQTLRFPQWRHSLLAGVGVAQSIQFTQLHL